MLTEHQMQQRQGKLTASRVPEIINAPYAAWLKITGRVPEQEAGDAAALGTFLEDGVLRASEHFGNFKIRKRNVWRVAANGIMGATLDAVTTNDDIVEAKTTAVFSSWSPTDEWGDPGTDEVPERVLLQVVAQQVCTPEAARTHIAAMIGRGFNLYAVVRDAELCGLVEDKVLRFWRDHVEGDTPPENIEGVSLDLLKHVQRAPGKSIELDAAIVDRFVMAKEAAKAAEEEVKNARAVLEVSMQDAEEVMVGGVKRVSYKTSKGRITFNQKQLEADDPETFKRYVGIGPAFRTLRIVGNKGEGE